jgi:hypothetical protein
MVDAKIAMSIIHPDQATVNHSSAYILSKSASGENF